LTFGLELVVLHRTPSKLAEILVHTSRFLYWLIEGQTHFGMPMVAKMSLAICEWKQIAIHSN
jgi:hypothetical protein